MSDEFAELILTIDTREKSIERINSIHSYFQGRGAYIQKTALHRCDYQIDGIYRDADINLGIEYKTIEDFAGSYQDLSWKLAESYDNYSDVGLFVETGNYDLIDVENGTLVRNYKIKDRVGTLRFDIFQNMLRSFERNGIYTQTFINVFEFPRSVHNLLNYVVKPDHRGIQYKNIDYDNVYKNMLMQFPGIGAKKAIDIVNTFPSFHELSLNAEYLHQETLGKKTGHLLYEFCRNGRLDK